MNEWTSEESTFIVNVEEMYRILDGKDSRKNVKTLIYCLFDMYVSLREEEKRDEICRFNNNAYVITVTTWSFIYKRQGTEEGGGVIQPLLHGV